MANLPEKSKKIKLVLSLLALFLLIVSLPVAAYLVKRRQEIRKMAYPGQECVVNTDCSGYPDEECRDGVCVSVTPSCCEECCGTLTATARLTRDVPAGHQVTFNVVPQGEFPCGGEACGGGIKEGSCTIGPGENSCSVTNLDCTGGPFIGSVSGWGFASLFPPDMATANMGFEGRVLGTSDQECTITAGNPEEETCEFVPSDGVTPTPTPTSPPTPTSTPTPTPTLTPTPTPTPACTGKCEEIKAYDEGWSEITDLSTLQIGQTVNFAVRGITDCSAGFTKGRFRINEAASSDWCTGAGNSIVDNWCEATNRQTVTPVPTPTPTPQTVTPGVCSQGVLINPDESQILSSVDEWDKVTIENTGLSKGKAYIYYRSDNPLVSWIEENGGRVSVCGGILATEHRPSSFPVDVEIKNYRWWSSGDLAETYPPYLCAYKDGSCATPTPHDYYYVTYVIPSAGTYKVESMVYCPDIGWR